MTQKLNVLMVENGFDPFTGEQFHGMRVYYMYACGHCSGQQHLAGPRETPDYRCVSCSRYLCHRAICHARCTPLYSMAKDKFEGAGKYGLLVPAIMAGAQTLEDAAVVTPNVVKEL